MIARRDARFSLLGSGKGATLEIAESLDTPKRELNPVPHPELLINRYNVVLHGSLRDPKVVGDFLVGAAQCNEAGQLPLAWS